MLFSLFLFGFHKFVVKNVITEHFFVVIFVKTPYTIEE